MDIQIEITDTILKTERLILRSWREEDVHDFYEYASGEGVGEMAGWRHHESLETSKEILKSFMADKNVFAVVFRDTDKVIGSVGLHYSWANEDPVYQSLKLKEIGYVLSKQYWGQGLMSEAVNAVISFCFDDQGLDALTVSYFTTNRQSRRVIEKCGFQYVDQAEYYAKQLQKHFMNMRYILFR